MEIRNPSLEEAKRRRYSVRTVRFEFLKLLDINVSCRAGSGMRTVAMSVVVMWWWLRLLARQARKAHLRSGARGQDGGLISMGVSLVGLWALGRATESP